MEATYKKPGDLVEEGDILFILEVMKMEVPYEHPLMEKLRRAYLR